MEFWGVEVKSGQRLKVKPEFGKLVHISHAAAGEVKGAKGAKNVPLKVKIGGNEFVMGFLSADRPQVMFDLVFEREFELSHDWKQGSVYFIGYLANDPDSSSDEEDFSSEFEDDLVGAVEKGNIKHIISENAKLAAAKGNVIKHISENVKPAAAKVEDSDSSDEDSDGSESSSDDGMPIIGEEGYSDLSSDDDSDELSESSDEEKLPEMKTQQSMKRPAETAQKTPVSKKAKQATTPDKSGNKKGHNTTPFPSKTAAGKKSNEQPPNKRVSFKTRQSGGGK